MSALREMIVGNINSFKQTPAMVQVIENLSDRDEKLIVLNNSSLLREKVTTTKSPKYLCFSAKEGPITSSDCFVVTGTQQNSDFKVIDKTDNKIKSTVSLDSALEVELQQLGDLVYVLIGKIEDTVVVEAAIEDEDYSRVVLNPSISNQADVGDGYSWFDLWMTKMTRGIELNRFSEAQGRRQKEWRKSRPQSQGLSRISASANSQSWSFLGE